MVRLFYPKYRSIYQIEFLLLLGWVLIFFWQERLTPYLATSRCQWAEINKHDGQKLDETRVLLVADPQLIDNHTYPGRNEFLLDISKHTADVYLKRNIKSLLSNLKPDYIFFLGDYLDNGRSSSDEYYAKELKRFKGIFHAEEYKQNKNLFTNVPGNHDIGFGDGVKSHAVDRYKENFGPTNVVVTIGGVEFISMDTISFSASRPEIKSESAKFLDSLEEKSKPRVLLTHVPLYRDVDKNKCGALRENPEFHLGKGYQYQSALEQSVSVQIINKIKPDIIFSGDDHDYCDILHSEVNSKPIAREITVKSISMAMGIWLPAVQLLTFKAPAHGITHLSYETSICYLPRPYMNIVCYIVMAVCSGVIMLIGHFKSRTSRHNYNILPMSVYSQSLPSQEIASNTKRLSNFIKNQDLEPKTPTIDASIYSFNTGRSTNYSPLNNFKSLIKLYYKKWNISFLLKNISAMTAIVLGLYLGFCWTL